MATQSIIKWTNTFSGNSQGWSETFYYNATTDDLDVALALVTPIASKRALLLATGYTLNDIRVGVYLSVDGTYKKRQVRLSEVGLSGIPTWPAAAPQYTCMCQFFNYNNTALKKLYMRGIPAGLGDLGRVPDQANVPGWKTNWNQWTAAMIALPAGWLGSTLSLQNAIINYVADAVTGIVTITCAGAVTWPLGLNVPQTVYIKLPNKSPLDGNVVVIPSSATECKTAKPYGVAPFSLVGNLYTRVKGIVTVGSVTGPQGKTGSIFPQRIISHKVGKPSYASRGRARATTRW